MARGLDVERGQTLVWLSKQSQLHVKPRSKPGQSYQSINTQLHNTRERMASLANINSGPNDQPTNTEPTRVTYTNTDQDQNNKNGTTLLFGAASLSYIAWKILRSINAQCTCILSDRAHIHGYHGYPWISCCHAYIIIIITYIIMPGSRQPLPYSTRTHTHSAPTRVDLHT